MKKFHEFDEGFVIIHLIVKVSISHQSFIVFVETDAVLGHSWFWYYYNKTFFDYRLNFMYLLRSKYVEYMCNIYFSFKRFNQIR